MWGATQGFGATPGYGSGFNQPAFNQQAYGAALTPQTLAAAQQTLGVVQPTLGGTQQTLGTFGAALPQGAQRPGPYTQKPATVTKDQLPAPQRVGRGAVEVQPITVVPAKPEPKPKPPAQKGKGRGKKAAKAAAKANEPQPTAVSVEGFSPDVTWKELKEHMTPAGSVQAVQMVKSEGGEEIGKACVKFTNEADAKKAVDMFSGSQFKGQILIVEQWVGEMPYMPGSAQKWDDWNPMMMMMGMMMSSWMEQQSSQKKADPAQMVYVSGMNSSITWQDLKEHMKPAGTVERARKMKQETGHVSFSKPEEAQKAISELNGSKLKDCTITVEKWT